MPFYTNDEIRVLKRAFDLACADLGLHPGRRVMRKRLGVVIFEIAAGGVSDCATLRRQSVRRFRNSDTAGRAEADAPEIASFITRLNRPLPDRPGK